MFVLNVSEVFRAAAEASPHDILKLYNTKGNLVNISAKLAENTPESRYQLDVIAAHLNGTCTLVPFSDIYLNNRV